MRLSRGTYGLTASYPSVSIVIMMKYRQLLLCAAAGLTAVALQAPSAMAQRVSTTQGGGVFQGFFPSCYVDSQGGDDSDTGKKPGQAFKTIGRALALYDSMNAGGLLGCGPLTINLMPGTYDANSGEVFPLHLPATGIVLEAYGDAMPVLSGGTPGNYSDIIVVDKPGNPCRPGTLIQNLHLDQVYTGILIDPDVGGSRGHSAVEVRNCEISEISYFALKIQVNDSNTAEHIIEGNEIHGNPDCAAGGIMEVSWGSSSCLYRSNDVHDVEDCLIVSGVGEACVPRIFSNFFHGGERLITLSECRPFIVNNTLTNVRIWCECDVNLWGIKYTDGLESDVVLANNIIWTPSIYCPEWGPFGDLIVPDVAGELTVAGAFACDFEDLAPSPVDPLTGNVGIDPLFVSSSDPHLQAGSPVIDLGWAYFARMVPGLTAPGPADTDSLFPDLTTSYAGNIVRRDIPVDIDGGSRFVRKLGGNIAKVSMGGDEISTVSMELIPNSVDPASATDAFGTMASMGPMGPLPSVQVKVRVHGPPGAGVALFPTLVMNPVDHNVFLGGFGNGLVDLLTPGFLLLGGPVGVLDAQGTAVLSFTLSGAYTQLAPLEQDIYLQAAVLATGSSTDMVTERLRLEFDQ